MTEAKEPAWLTYEQVIAIHSLQLRRFGGASGLRDEGMLRSALERPVNKWHYEQADLPELAAAYAFGFAKNHAFVDGNKRIAFMSDDHIPAQEWGTICPRSGAGNGYDDGSCRRRGQRGKPRALDPRQLAALMACKVVIFGRWPTMLGCQGLRLSP